MGYDPNGHFWIVIIGAVTSAIDSVYKKGMHPAVKKAAKKLVSENIKYIVKEIKSCLIDDATTELIVFAASETAIKCLIDY